MNAVPGVLKADLSWVESMGNYGALTISLYCYTRYFK